MARADINSRSAHDVGSRDGLAVEPEVGFAVEPELGWYVGSGLPPSLSSSLSSLDVGCFVGDGPSPSSSLSSPPPPEPPRQPVRSCFSACSMMFIVHSW